MASGKERPLADKGLCGVRRRYDLQIRRVCKAALRGGYFRRHTALPSGGISCLLPKEMVTAQKPSGLN